MSTNPPPLPLPDDDETAPYALMGTVRAKKDMADELERRLVAMVAPTRREPGALSYHVHRDRSDRSRFVFYEAWQTIDDLRRHFEEPHVSAFLRDRHTYIEGDLEVTWLRMLGPF